MTDQEDRERRDDSHMDSLSGQGTDTDPVSRSASGSDANATTGAGRNADLDTSAERARRAGSVARSGTPRRAPAPTGLRGR